MITNSIVRQKSIKSKISDFKAALSENLLFCPISKENSSSSSLENIYPLEKVELRGFCGNYHLTLKIVEDDFYKIAQGYIGDNFISLRLKNNSSSSIIAGVLKNNKNNEKIRLLNKLTTNLIGDKFIYEKITSGKIGNINVNLVNKSRFLRWQGISQKNLSGKLNQDRILIILNDMGKVDNHKTLITGSIYRNSAIQTFNIIALWRKNYGYLHQIDSYLLPLLIYSVR